MILGLDIIYMPSFYHFESLYLVTSELRVRHPRGSQCRTSSWQVMPSTSASKTPNFLCLSASIGLRSQVRVRDSGGATWLAKQEFGFNN